MAATRSEASESSASAGPARSRTRSAGCRGPRAAVCRRGRLAEEQASARAGETASPGRNSGGRRTAARITCHGSAPPNGASLPAATATPAVDEGAQPPQVRQVFGRHVPCVLLAPLGDEVRLRDDREPAQVRHGLGRDHRAVLDPVAGQPPRGVQRGERENELDARHAVHRYRAPGGVRLTHVVGEVVKRRQRGVVEQDLHRPRLIARLAAGRNLRGRHAVQPLRDVPSRGQRRQRSSAVAPGVASVKPVTPSAAALPLTAGQVRRPRAGTRSASQRSIRHSRPSAGRRCRAPRPAAARTRRSSEPGGGGGIHYPERAGAVLHPHRAVGEEPVERPAVQGPGDRLVVADAAQPGARRQRRVGRAQLRARSSAVRTCGGPTGTLACAAASARR